MFKAYTEIHDQPGDEGLAYLAACCARMNKKEEYLKYLKQACERNPLEARKIFADDFPIGMDPKDYYDYEVSKDTVNGNDDR